MWNQVVLVKLSARRTLARMAAIALIVGVIFTANASVLTSVTPASTT